MTIAINIRKGWAWPKLQKVSAVTAKKGLGNTVLAKVFYTLYINSKMEQFGFKSGCVVWVVKRLKKTGL